MTKAPEVWILAVNGRRGRLWRGCRTEMGSPHVDAIAEIDNTWEEHEHGRPSPLAAKNGHTNASRHHEVETLRHRFTKDVVAWAEHQVGRRGIDRLHLFAPPRLRGSFRQQCSTHLAGHVEEHEENIASMTPADAAQHRVVRQLLESPR